MHTTAFSNIGEFLSGNIDFFTITTLVPVDTTGVTKPILELKSDMGVPVADNISTKDGFTLFGTTYANDVDYTDAYAKQYNLDTFLRLIETRAQAIMLNVVDNGVVGNVTNAIPAGSHVTDYGTTYSGAGGTIYTIKFATEHEDAWNETSLAQELDNRETLDLATPVITNPDVFDTSSAALTNTAILKNQFI